MTASEKQRSIFCPILSSANPSAIVSRGQILVFQIFFFDPEGPRKESRPAKSYAQLPAEKNILKQNFSKATFGICKSDSSHRSKRDQEFFIQSSNQNGAKRRGGKFLHNVALAASLSNRLLIPAIEGSQGPAESGAKCGSRRASAAVS